MEYLISTQDILKFIPQRPPILMIDNVTAYTKGHSIITSKWLDENSEGFRGHFPELPILPGVLLVEAAAQTGAILMQLEALNWQPNYKFDIVNSPSRIGVLGRTRVRFRQPAFPNTQLFIHGTIDWFRQNSMALKVKVYNESNDLLMDGIIILSTTLKAKLYKRNIQSYVSRTI